MIEEASAEKRLYEAAIRGDVAAFKQVLHEDPHLLERVSFASSNKTPLHIATMHGQVSIVEAALDINAQLALDLDSKNSTCLHIAAAQGSLEIAKKLLSVAPETRWWRDCHDLNPIHVAAMKGHVEVLKELLRLDFVPAMERVHCGQTVLHLCVKHRQLPALKVLAKKLGDLVDAEDNHGETILHLAVRCHHLETIQYLVQSNTIEVQRTNNMGNTALRVLYSYPPDTASYSEMENTLLSLSNQSIKEALPRLTDTTMVVVVLIATMAFQAAVSPPGGVWQDDSSSHRAGEAVMASTHPKIYNHFVRANATAFVSSLITIFLVITGLPSGSIFFHAIATYAMWLSLTSTAVSYGASTIASSPNAKARSLSIVITTVVAGSLSFVGLLALGSVTHGVYLLWKSERRRQDHLTTISPILRIFYWIFERLKPREDLRVNRRWRTFVARMV